MISSGLKSLVILFLLLGFALAQDDDLVLDYQTAVDFAQLPLDCYQQEYSHKFGLTYASTNDLNDPKVNKQLIYK